MPTLFTRVIEGELPGRFVYRDDRCVAFLTIEPLSPGHTLVVPIEEVDHWIDLDAELATHLMLVAQRIAKSIQQIYQPSKVALWIEGLEVPHVHLHVAALPAGHGLDVRQIDHHAKPEDLDAAAAALQAALA